MKQNIKPCLELPLPDKAKAGTAVPDEAWFAAAEAAKRIPPPPSE
jgi:hypothetical protein